MDFLATQMAYDAGAKIILITDKASSPLAQYATQILTVSVDSNTFFNSYVAVLFTMELLCSFISKKMGYSTEAKLELIDKYLSKVGLFWKLSRNQKACICRLFCMPKIEF